VSDLKALAEHRAKTAATANYQIPVDVADDILGVLS